MKRVLITGATSGIGKATALELLKRGFEVVFIARDIEKAGEVKKELADLTGREPYFIEADLASLEQVRRAADIFKHKFQTLDVLINNAGVMLPSRRITDDGLEETFEVNHLSHFLLTNLLLEDLINVSEGRIINVSSGLYKRGVFDPDNLQGEKSFSPRQAYNNSKLLNILFTIELAEKLKGTGITVNALHPGVVRTNFGNEQKGPVRILIRLFRPLFLTPEEGARTTIYLATSEEVEDVSGKYFEKCKEVEPGNPYITRENMELLWDKSIKLAGLG
jgi:NAD(P)-dependent dehydrogenase (short-subunit alcohol dehydrogenase family)